MNISNEIIKILDDLGERFGIAVDWSNKNIIPYLEELCDRFINWQITTSVVWSVLGIVALIFGVISVIRIWKRKDSYRYFGDPDEGITWLFIGALALVVLGIIVIMVQCFDICRCLYMPELEIYNYIQWRS